jgi:hypothetical protein
VVIGVGLGDGGGHGEWKVRRSVPSECRVRAVLANARAVRLLLGGLLNAKLSICVLDATKWLGLTSPRNLRAGRRTFEMDRGGRKTFGRDEPLVGTWVVCGRSAPIPPSLLWLGSLDRHRDRAQEVRLQLAKPWGGVHRCANLR